MNRIYVIAGTFQQFIVYKNRKQVENDGGGEEYVYVGSSNTIRGIKNPRGVFIGTWRKRPDIMDVLMQLRVCQSHLNPSLEKIWDSMKVTSTTQQIVTVNVTQAQEDLSKAIDAHILAKVHSTIKDSGWGSLLTGKLDSVLDMDTKSYKNYWRNDYGS